MISNPPVFPPDYRGCGILLHVTSLPSPFGIGDFGPTAFAWVDRLVEAGQGWWQVLPLGPTGLGDSPYEPLCTFAANELLVSPVQLIADGLLQPGDCATGETFPADRVDYEAVALFKHRLLEKAWSNFQSGANRDFEQPFELFCHAHARWLDDYSLYRALKLRLGGANYHAWPVELVRRDPQALSRARQDLTDVVDRFRFGQFLVFRQGQALREYARGRGLRLMGDVPFVVSHDSSDVWSDPDLFLLDADRKPVVVAGVPPDYFSAQGQLWGNPVYDWDAMSRDGYRWWIERLRAFLRSADVVRLDHFRGFAASWHIPAGSETAVVGQWVPGPGADFFLSAAAALGGLPFVAEDLGLITDDVIALRDQFHLPGMRVLQFAFDGDPKNPFLPHNYPTNAVAYTGTHDNDTTRGWYESLSAVQQEVVRNYLGLDGARGDSREVSSELFRVAWKSAAALAIAPLQDLLSLGTEARMNVPGCAVGNWRWRATEEMLSSPAFERLKELTDATHRTLVAPPTAPPDVVSP